MRNEGRRRACPRRPSAQPPQQWRATRARRRLAGGRPFKILGLICMAPPPSDRAGAGGPVPPAPGSLFLSSPELGLLSSNWDSESGLFLVLARLQEGVSLPPLGWLLFFL